MVSNDCIIVNNELERMWKEAVWPSLRYYPDMYLEELRKTTKNLCRDRECPERDSNQAPAEIRSKELSVEQTCSIK
jgi:hypothetical protein